MKVLFNEQESLRLAPPKYPKGIKFVKRIVLNRDKVTYPKEKNPRVLNLVAEKIPEIRDSFLANGYVHTCQPPTVKVDPNNKNHFIGLSGYHRNAAAEQANWDTMIYDVLEFDSPLSERTHRIVTNHVFTPSSPNTTEDLVKQVKEAVANNEIPDIENEIKSFIDIIAADKPESTRQKIYKRFKESRSPSDTLLCYHSGTGENSTAAYAKKQGLPYGGKANWKTTGRFGYITKESTPRITLHDAKVLSRRNGDVMIEIYGYISSPIDGQALLRQRKEYKESFDKFIENDCLMIQHYLSFFDVHVPLIDIVKRHPVKLIGFLPQDITPDSTNGGLPKEQGIVDVDGNGVNLDLPIKKLQSNSDIMKEMNKLLGIDEEIPLETLDIVNI